MKCKHCGHPIRRANEKIFDELIAEWIHENGMYGCWAADGTQERHLAYPSGELTEEQVKTVYDAMNWHMHQHAFSNGNWTCDDQCRRGALMAAVNGEIREQWEVKNGAEGAPENSP